MKRERIHLPKLGSITGDGKLYYRKRTTVNYMYEFPFSKNICCNIQKEMPKRILMDDLMGVR